MWRDQVGLRAAGKLLWTGFGVTQMNNGLRAPKVAFLRRKIDEAVRIASRHFADAADGDDDGRHRSRGSMRFNEFQDPGFS